VSFPIADKISVKASLPRPFFKWAAVERPLDTPRWNFHKYFVGRDGHIATVLATVIAPTDSRAIEKELAGVEALTAAPRPGMN